MQAKITCLCCYQYILYLVGVTLFDVFELMNSQFISQKQGKGNFRSVEHHLPHSVYILQRMLIPVSLENLQKVMRYTEPLLTATHKVSLSLSHLQIRKLNTGLKLFIHECVTHMCYSQGVILDTVQQGLKHSIRQSQCSWLREVKVC